ncbi:MAG: glycosyltransferase family 4 protein [Eubacteriales bacterium]
MKVFLLAEKPTQNSVAFWNLLGKQCELTVAFQEYADKDGEWVFSPAGNSFKFMYLTGINLGKGVGIAYGIKRIINEEAFDVFVINDYETGAEKAAIKELIFSGKKFILANEGAMPHLGESSLIGRNKAAYMKSAYSYLSCGSACDAYLASYGVDERKIVRYNYAAFSEKDFLLATPMTEPRRRGLKKRYQLKDNIFISTIHFTEDQGIDILLEIWKLAGIDNADLLLISDAKAQKQLHKMVKSMQINNIVMLDYQPKELTRELIRISKAMIYPARYDKWGLPVVEALSCGIPAISSYTVGAVHDLIINEKTGYIRNINEPASWGESMREIMKRDILWNKMKDNSFEAMKKFTIESRVRTYITAFKKCAIVQNK